jgi:hypothetical protein
MTMTSQEWKREMHRQARRRREPPKPQGAWLRFVTWIGGIVGSLFS